MEDIEYSNLSVMPPILLRIEQLKRTTSFFSQLILRGNANILKMQIINATQKDFQSRNFKLITFLNFTFLCKKKTKKKSAYFYLQLQIEIITLTAGIDRNQKLKKRKPIKRMKNC